MAGLRMVLLVLSIVVGMGVVWAQEMVVIVPTRRIVLTELFDHIGRQTRSTVVFDADDATLHTTVELPSDRGSVAAMLDAALPAGYTWKRVDRYILVAPAEHDRKPEEPAIAPFSVKDFDREVDDFSSRNFVVPAPEVRRDTIFVEHARPATDFAWPDRTAAIQVERLPRVAFGTNVLWWAARGTINGSLEWPLGGHISMSINGGINRWNLKGSESNNRKLAHWVVRPELRIWFCERMDEGHFVGLHAFYGHFNIGGVDIPGVMERKFRYEGRAIGAGVGYGYNMRLDRRWGMEFTAGVGLVGARYTKSECEKCGLPVYSGRALRILPTNVGVKLIFNL